MIATAIITIKDLREIEVGATAPANPTENTIWVDTSVTPNLEKRWNGNAWVVVNDVSQNTVVTTMQSNLSVAEGKISTVVTEIWPSGDMTQSSRIDVTSNKINWAVEDTGTGQSSNMQLTAAALSFIGQNVDLDLNGDFNTKAQAINANAEKINWVASKDGQTGVISLTPNAMSYIGDNVELNANNSVNIRIGNAETAIQNAANTAQGAMEAAEAVQTSLNATTDSINAQIADHGEILSMMELTAGGLKVKTGDSIYSTLTDGEGFHVYQGDTRIASFANNGVTAHSFTMGRVVCRKTSAGGWAWNLVS